MDDDIICHYSNESTFIITIAKNEQKLEGRTTYDVTLEEIDVETK